MVKNIIFIGAISFFFFLQEHTALRTANTVSTFSNLYYWHFSQFLLLNFVKTFSHVRTIALPEISRFACYIGLSLKYSACQSRLRQTYSCPKHSSDI